MKCRIEYCLICELDGDFEDFERRVNKKIVSEGWKPQGGVCIHDGGRVGGDTIICQGMIRTVRVEEDW